MEVVGKIKHHKKSISYKWTIDDFCDVRKEYVPGQAVFSPTFYTDIKCQWQLKLWPQGRTEDDKDFISLYVYYLSKSSVKANITFSVVDKEEEVNKKSTESRQLFEEGKAWGYPEYYYSGDICKTLLDSDNKLIIKCKIELVREACRESYRNEKEIDLRMKECERLEKLLVNNKFSDVTLSVDGEKIRAHKCILAAKSSVFTVMFEHDMAEKQCNLVEIQDIAPNVLKEMLRYIYTGKVNNLNELAMELLIAAEKYLLANLKSLCEETLCSDLSPSNAIKYLNLAESHNAPKLKAQAIQYIVSNAKQIIEDSEFESYAELQSDTICKVFRELIIQKVKSQ